MPLKFNKNYFFNIHGFSFASLSVLEFYWNKLVGSKVYFLYWHQNVRMPSFISGNGDGVDIFQKFMRDPAPKPGAAH